MKNTSRKNLRIFAYRHRRVNSKATGLAEAALQNGELGLWRHFPPPHSTELQTAKKNRQSDQQRDTHTHTHSELPKRALRTDVDRAQL